QFSPRRRNPDNHEFGVIRFRDLPVAIPCCDCPERIYAPCGNWQILMGSIYRCCCRVFGSGCTRQRGCPELDSAQKSSKRFQSEQQSVREPRQSSRREDKSAKRQRRRTSREEGSCLIRRLILQGFGPT